VRPGKALSAYGLAVRRSPERSSRRRAALISWLTMEDRIPHWSEDPYWTNALERYYAARDSGETKIEIDFAALEASIFNGEGPAYRLMHAMCSVHALEGMDGYRGAPRLVLALLAILGANGGASAGGPPD
jgi:hypothetical protein